VKKKQRVGLINEEKTGKRKRKETKKKEKTKTEKEIEAIETAFTKIDVKVVLKEAKEKANNLNFKEGMGDYVALVVLSMGKAAGVPKMSANAISEMADELGLRGNKKMSENTITSAISRSTTTNFLHHEGEGKYSVADELKKKKKTKKEAKSDHPVVPVKRGEWDLKKFEDVGFYGNENKWCPLCDGRTVVNVSYVMFYSHEFLMTRTKEVLIERYGNEIKREQVNKVLDYYFEEKLKTGPRRDIKNFDTVCRESEEVCWHCWTKLREWLKSEWLKR